MSRGRKNTKGWRHGWTKGMDKGKEKGRFKGMMEGGCVGRRNCRNKEERNCTTDTTI